MSKVKDNKPKKFDDFKELVGFKEGGYLSSASVKNPEKLANLPEYNDKDEDFAAFLGLVKNILAIDKKHSQYLSDSWLFNKEILEIAYKNIISKRFQEKNKKLEEKNKELEEKNKELEEKNKELENLKKKDNDINISPIKKLDETWGEDSILGAEEKEEKNLKFSQIIDNTKNLARSFYAPTNNKVKTKERLSKSIIENDIKKKPSEIWQKKFSLYNSQISHKTHNKFDLSKSLNFTDSFFGDNKLTSSYFNVPVTKKDILNELKELNHEEVYLEAFTEDLQKDSEIVLALIKSDNNLDSIKEIHPDLQEDKEFFQNAMDINVCAFKYASKKLKCDIDLINKALATNYTFIEDIADDFWQKDNIDNIKIVFELIKEKQYAVSCLYQKCNDFIDDLIKKGVKFDNVSKDILKKEKYWLEIIADNPKAIRSADYNSTDYDYKKIAEKAMELSNGEIFYMLHDSIKKDAKFITEMAKQYNIRLGVLPKELKEEIFAGKHKDLLKELIKSNAYSVFREEKLKQILNNKEYILLAVETNGNMLSCLDVKWTKDRDVVITAIKQNVEALYYADSKYQKLINNYNEKGQDFYISSTKDDQELIDIYCTSSYIQAITECETFLSEYMEILGEEYISQEDLKIQKEQFISEIEELKKTKNKLQKQLDETKKELETYKNSQNSDNKKITEEPVKEQKKVSELEEENKNLIEEKKKLKTENDQLETQITSIKLKFLDFSKISYTDEQVRKCAESYANQDTIIIFGNERQNQLFIDSKKYFEKDGHNKVKFIPSAATIIDFASILLMVATGVVMGILGGTGTIPLNSLAFILPTSIIGGVGATAVVASSTVLLSSKSYDLYKSKEKNVSASLNPFVSLVMNEQDGDGYKRL
jgi:hypothetical protein